MKVEKRFAVVQFYEPNRMRRIAQFDCAKDAMRFARRWRQALIRANRWIESIDIWPIRQGDDWFVTMDFLVFGCNRIHYRNLCADWE
jgi:hypothetical protein